MSEKTGSIAKAVAEGDLKKATELKKELGYDLSELPLDDPYTKAVSVFGPLALLSRKYNNYSVFYQYNSDDLAAVCVDLQNRFPNGVPVESYANFMAYMLAILEAQKA